jgi:glycerol-3-phosphate acyltransferase PlsY
VLFLALALCFFIGALPVGYWLTRLTGLDPRRTSAHNIGLENTTLLQGPFLTGLVFGLDLLKGVLAVALMQGFANQEGVFAGALLAYLGYLYPPRLFFMMPSWANDSHRHRVPIRGRGVALLLGLLAALTTVAGAPAWMGWLALGLWGVVAGLSGYASAATLTTASSFAILLQFLPLSGGSRLLVIGLLALVFWRFKENIGRMLEVVEPKLGDAPPIGGQKANQAVAAFIIHPLYIDGFWKSRRFGLLHWLYGRGILTDGFLTEMGKRVRPIKIGELRGIYTKAGVEIRCHIITAPLMPEVFKSDPELAKLRAIQGARLAQELGASVYGLGAFFGTVAKKGLEVQEAVPEVHVTNGGAYHSGGGAGDHPPPALVGARPAQPDGGGGGGQWRGGLWHGAHDRCRSGHGHFDWPRFGTAGALAADAGARLPPDRVPLFARPPRLHRGRFGVLRHLRPQPGGLCPRRKARSLDL